MAERDSPTTTPNTVPASPLENNDDSRDSSSSNITHSDTSATLRQRRQQQRERLEEHEALLNHRHPSPYDLQEPRVENGRTVGGTGRLPRDAAFTPTYINTFTVNSFIALISIVVTCTFFYFKIIAGLLESPQIGRSIGFGSRGIENQLLHPDDVLYYQQFEGEPRTDVEPICPTDSENHRIDSMTDDGCPHFGRIVVLADTIARFGTSHATHGWIGSLVDEWAGRADVIVRSFPGTAAAAAQTGRQGNPHPSLIIIALGTDDAALPFTRQHVSIDEFTDHLKSIVQKFQYPDSPNFSPHHRIILVTPGPVHDDVWAKSLADVDRPLDRLNNVTKEYAEAVQRIGNELRIPVVDLWREIMCQISAGPVINEDHIAGGIMERDPELERQQTLAKDVLGVEPCTVHESSHLDHYLTDGLHLRRMGNEVLSKSILNAVAIHYPEMHPRCWNTIYPGYETLDPSADQTAIRWHCQS
ncbi:isoamyl acetate-hydrolyzing esterase [Actinomortierella wolfii]|nr:isoamyl acetate-hydrolyzing esterase [Actinomortierella wolfii]